METRWKTAGKILLIPAGKIRPNPMRSRTYYNNERLDELKASIEENGLLEPLAVTEENEESFLLLSGERRYKAAIKAGLEELPCILYSPAEAASDTYSLIYNQQQLPLNYLEEAEAIERLRLSGIQSLHDLSAKLGKPESYILNKLRYLSIPKDIRDRMLEAGINENYASIIIKIESDKRKKELVERIVKDQLTLSEAQTAAKESSVKPKGKIVTLFGDLTVFTNTVEKAINTLLNSGMMASSSKEETEEYINYVISIRKPG